MALEMRRVFTKAYKETKIHYNDINELQVKFENLFEEVNQEMPFAV